MMTENEMTDQFNTKTARLRRNAVAYGRLDKPIGGGSDFHSRLPRHRTGRTGIRLEPGFSFGWESRYTEITLGGNKYD